MYITGEDVLKDYEGVGEGLSVVFVSDFNFF